ncbi:hypothetical protein [Pontibacter korlensis]|nr:hypothetical protein [Pontibacter korlensis]
MQKDKYGYFTAELQDVQPETKYFFMPDGEKAILIRPPITSQMMYTGHRR